MLMIDKNGASKPLIEWGENSCWKEWHCYMSMFNFDWKFHNSFKIQTQKIKTTSNLAGAG